MPVKDRDPLTGHRTTGHEWDGIVELNTRVPKAVWIFAIVTHLWAVIIWILLPTWPLVVTYTKGILGADDRKEVRLSVIAANEARADWASRIDSLEPEEILSDDLLLQRVRGAGHRLFGDNCAVCHGMDGDGGPGFPSLLDDAWLWGGDFDEVLETIRVGINSDHDETRYAEMMAFGELGVLSRDEVHVTVDYVRSLSGLANPPADRLAEGEEIFMDNCSSCHGEDGTGDMDLGAPDLTDDFWIYGGSKKDVFTTIYGGRQGWMPAWETRLTETDRKILALYVEDLHSQAKTDEVAE